ncbi:MAG: isoleucine--tRNA ligase [Actinomycetota bacterium]|nr:isoleucine--tRNA ligase [Actinomycetota bacterium]
MTEPDSASVYRPVPSQLDLPAVDREILAYWRANDTFAKSLALTAGGEPWTFYEGPPTANGAPGAHHIEARVFKDVFPRFRTMQGRYVERRAGWDCHGLPVELAVETELGFAGKGDIERYGIAEFNARCRESVLRHVDDFSELTERMGYWVDMDAAYRTMDPDYVDSVWWALAQIYERGLLVEDHRVTPYCPRCGTGLSDHELAQGYETVVDPSVYVRFPLTSGPLAGTAALVVWTTTPWTLVSNTAVAVHPDVTYIALSDGSETLVVAAPLAGQALGDGWTPTGERFLGSQMRGWTYARPFELVELPAPSQMVTAAEFVTVSDGSGIVHLAPAFGADDMAIGRRDGLPVVNPVTADGHFESTVPLVGGSFFKSADPALVDDLEARGLLVRAMQYEHAYPHCWRCHTPLIYYARPSWYIRTTAVKDALMRENEATNWFPGTIKWGRYGDWLRNNVDWALSRDRYWGTPLPIWRCADGHAVCVESRAHLGRLAGHDVAEVDPHRPFIDDVVIPCPTCGEPAQRVPQVIDAWFDSGSMPFAQIGYPHASGSAERFASSYPADFICEGLDQTRGWFYTLMAIGTLVFDQSSYRNVLCLGIILADDGRRMSKHLGNILPPIPLMDEHGADAVRWFMAAGGSPWAARRVGHDAINETVRRVFLTYWNTVSFHVLYAGTSRWRPNDSDPAVESRPVLDRWLVSRTAALVDVVTSALEQYDTLKAGTAIAAYTDDLSNWYVRRSRRRFWTGDPAALRTLHDALDTLTRLMAPMVPFLTEKVWQDVIAAVDPDGPESVHLASWPERCDDRRDAGLDAAVELARRLVELGRAARTEAKVKTRQPLARAVISSSSHARLPPELLDEVAAELNVASVEPLSSDESLVAYSVKANFRSLGARFGPRTQTVAAAIAAADHDVLAPAISGGGRATVDVDGEPVELGPDDVVVSERPHEGWSVVNESGETVALDLDITPSLLAAGLAREVARLVQETRKSAGLEVTDRIELWAVAEDETGAAIREHAVLIAAEVLATTVHLTPPDDGAALSTRTAEELAVRIWLRRDTNAAAAT